MIQKLTDIMQETDDVVVGTGGCGQDAAGVWAAWICIDENGGDHLGLVGYGDTEAKAIAALKAKCVALTQLVAAANEQAGAAFYAKRAKESKDMADKILDMLGGGTSKSTMGDLLYPKKKDEPEGEN